jgi:hypothetical protein
MRFSLNAIFHVAAGAVDLLVEPLGLGVLGAQRGDDKTGIGGTFGPFRLGNDPTLTAPTVARRPLELLEPACRLAGCFAILLGLTQFGGDLGEETVVLG